MQLCDTHCHLDDARYNEDFEVMLKRSYEVGITRFIIPAAYPNDLKRAQSLSHQYEGIYFAAGIHPNYAHLYDKDFIQSFVGDEKCVAIGECGLDYYRAEESLEEMGLESFEALKDLQKKVFIEQIKLALEVRKPLIVHIRDASLDSLEILLTYAKELKGGVLHCFNADFQLLSLAKYGFYYGIGGVLTFKNARKLVEVLPKIPLQSLLLETDSPYLTPHPHRGERNEPSYIPLVLERMSEILAIPKETLAKQINHNTQNLFGEYFRIL
ncbi:TatD family deoxyribonuclease [Helicobacter apodemus]|uniref:TatD family deoxyribonuclease n=1 Tax=Helicobacter apodemus TaxID=135569 RepID=A0A4U8UH14_9HELI|nr:TatD family hydrolase [Helicobacter apodemus]MDE6957988.1 TatD family hydrolase [Helicobacter apodemus]TLE13973.1 TatD family deoxyribonuclease [Helicobacter apodemus]